MRKDSTTNREKEITELLTRGWRFKNSDQFIRFVKFIERFTHYSRFNTMMVYIQDDSVTFFGGVSYWKKKWGRTVNEDAKPYIILAPNGPIMLVFDVMETDGTLSPEEFLIKGLGRKPLEVKGEISDKALKKAIDNITRWGFKVVFKKTSFFKGGHITTQLSGSNEICLKEGCTPTENFVVLLHEIAHLFLGHTGRKEINKHGTKKVVSLPSRNIKRSTEELEAETISYLICKKLGITTQAAEYIAGYIKTVEDLTNFDTELVIKTTDRIEKEFL